VDTVNIQPEFPVATTRWKNGAHVARAVIDADVRRFPQTLHRHQNWVFTLGSRAILEFPLGSGVLFSRTTSQERQRRHAVQRPITVHLEAPEALSDDNARKRFPAAGLFINNPLIRQRSRLLGCYSIISEWRIGSGLFGTG